NNIIDISQLQPGMYLIEVVSGERKIRGKLMIY
ncbi:MAG: T9SS type A sorting domain-containing protein, partial [Bacteroidales bacterium]|nr:T9SS type A sorting domain-containing protein [Bacteroidales bacterium]